MKKYSIELDRISGLYRIWALIDIPKYGIKIGGLGGLIEKEGNLSHAGDAWVSGDARVSGGALVAGDAWVSGGALVSGNAHVYGGALVAGDARVSGDAWVSGGAQVYGGAWDKSPLYIQGTKHTLTNCKYGYIQIGCECHTFDEWKEKAQEIGKEYRYTPDEITEYLNYIDLFGKIGK